MPAGRSTSTAWVWASMGSACLQRTRTVIVLGGSSGSENDGQNQVFTWNVSDPGSGLNAVSVSITKNGVEIYNSASASGSFDFNSSGLGTYAMSVSASDADSDWIGD